MKQPKKPKKLLGAAIQWTADDIADLSKVKNADVKAALALWRNEAPARFKNLLSAGVEGKQS